ncbi:unnamed protein product [Coccothraustes coccothraustes]
MISPLKHILVLGMADCRSVRPFVQGSSGAKLRELSASHDRGTALHCASLLKCCVSSYSSFHIAQPMTLATNQAFSLTLDNGFQFCKGTEYLEHCHVSCCPQLTDEAVKAMAFHCHRLTSASIGGCPKMIDTSTQHMAAACHYLPFLDISGCIHFTDNT